jgi:hypothetical protein
MTGIEGEVAIMKHIEQRMTALEDVVMKLAYVQLSTQVSIDNLSKEMKEFKDEMKEFKTEMSGFKTTVEQENRAINRRWAELAYKMGTIVEDIVAPNIPWVAKTYFKAEVIEDFMIRRKKTKSSDRSVQKEFDIIAVFDGKVILNETKATLRQEYIADFIEFVRKREFFDYFPEFKEKKLIPIFSSLYVPDTIVKHLTKQKICVMALRDETMDLLNPELAATI